jgi:hypothetical protein
MVVIDREAAVTFASQREREEITEQAVAPRW